MACCSALLRLLLGMHLLRSFGHVQVPTDVQEPKRSAMNIPKVGKYRSHLLGASTVTSVRGLRASQDARFEQREMSPAAIHPLGCPYRCMLAHHLPL
mmetsp:Transcript_36496/g.83703  ORF Transcript_36496/g.83703 Transcript_36496/m.83703 type:complete len:97 (+) Transcript_36496:238-528(+)